MKKIVSHSPFDQHEMIKAFNKAAINYDQAAVLQREVANRLDQRLAFITNLPKKIVDLGAGTGILSQFIAHRYREAEIINLDIVHHLLNHAKTKLTSRQYDFVCANAEELPFTHHSVDLVVSNLMLHWCFHPDKVLREIQRILKPTGFLLFSTLGPDTLIELRQSWAKVDNYVHVHEFIDMHIIGDMALNAHLIDPVLDVERIILQYQTPIKLLKDLKQLGVHNIAQGRSRNLTGKQSYQRFLQAYEVFRLDNGKYPATYEVIYGHALGSDIQQQEMTRGEVSIPLHQFQRK